MRCRYLLLLLLPTLPLTAQVAPPDSAARDSVIATVNRLFDGMRRHDSTLARSAFVPGATMLEVAPGGDAVSATSVDGFVAAIARPGEPWIERVFDPEVRIDGTLATYYAYYTFTLGERFLHCGVDAIWLIRTPTGWRISAIADTRRTTGCDRRD
jgi:hypothetical protein